MQDVQENLYVKLYTLEIIYKKECLRRPYSVQVLYNASVYTAKLEGTVN